jgi:hypothetical protein
MIQSSEIHAASIIGDVKTNASVQGYVSASPLSISADVSLGRVAIIHSDLPDYEGEYEVTPAIEAQILNTKNRTMRDDLDIKKIPYYDVANPYGRTIYIGSDVNA